MNNFSELLDSDRRLALLKSLMDGDGSLNESILQTVLDMLGHAVSRDKIRTDLAWLKEQGLVTLETIVNVQVAHLTDRGCDVAEGRAGVPGIKRPRPSGGRQ